MAYNPIKDLTLIRSQAPANCPSAEQWAALMRQRLSEQKMSLDDVAYAVAFSGEDDRRELDKLMDGPGSNKQEQVVRWLSGYEMPSEPQHSALLELLGYPTSEAIQSAEKKQAKGKKLSDKEQRDLRLSKTADSYKSLWDQANAELGQAERQEFDPQHIVQNDKGKPCRKPRLCRQRVEGEQDELLEFFENATRDNLEYFLKNPQEYGATVKDYLTGLRYYHGLDLDEVPDVYETARIMELREEHHIRNWTRKNGNHLPSRENFPKLQKAVKAIDPECANAFTDLFIQEGIHRWKGTNAFRHLPTEFWQAKVEKTNNSDCFQGRGDWREIDVKPCEHAGDYLLSVRRALGIRRNALLNEIANSEGMQLSYGALRDLEVTNETSPNSLNAVRNALRKLDTTEPALFSEATYARLPQPLYRGHPLTPDGNVQAPSARHEGKAIPALDLEAEFEQLARKLRVAHREPNRIKSLLPHSQKEIGQLSDIDIQNIMQRATSYMWLPKSPQNQSNFHDALTNLRDRAAGIETEPGISKG